MRRILFTTAALLLTAAATLVGSAEHLTHDYFVIGGRIVNDADGAPIAGASVALLGTSHSTVSRANGAYELRVPTGSVTGASTTLQVQAAGFALAEASISLQTGVGFYDFRLRASSLPLEEAVVDYGQSAAEKADAPGAPPPVASAPFIGYGIQSLAGNPAGYAGQIRMTRGSSWNTEAYNHIQENGFLSVADNPLSTFSIDVDRASYSNVRRFLLDGRLPPTDAVRIEEMINYFNYDYPRERGEHPFGVDVEVGAAPWKPGHLLMRIALASPRIETENLPPGNFVFLIDVSGSMQSPDKLPLVKNSMRLLVNQLRERDRVAIVVYAGAAGLVLPSTPGSQKERILEAIEGLEAGGSTAGGEGLRLAYSVARENHIQGGNNRVILASDGDFNVGESSDSEMIRLVEERRRQGTFLTVLGFGTGNLKDSRMEQMADHGNGNYAYIDSLLEARKVLVTEMGGTLQTVASDVKLQIEFNPAQVRAYRLIGYENRLLAAEDFYDDTKDAGELGSGHTVTALYEIVPVGVETDVEIRGTDPLRYQTRPGPAGGGAAPSDELGFVKIRYKRPGSENSILMDLPVRGTATTPSRDFNFAAAVAGFGMLLRESEYRGNMNPDRVIELAGAGQGGDPDGHRAEFVRLVEIYRGLALRE